MDNDISLIKRLQSALFVTFGFILVALILSFTKNLVVENWALRRDNVACVPADVDFSHPLVYRQSTYNPINEDALLKTFITQYVHYTQDEQIIDYHKINPSERYKDTQLSLSKWASIDMSVGVERALNMKKYSESSDVFYTLKKNNMGWIFLIDDIILSGVPKTGNVLAVVRGQFQVTYDNVKTELPPKLWGYRELYFILVDGFPVKDSKTEKYVNKTGWRVSWSSAQVLTPAQKEKLNSRNSDYYLLDEYKNTEESN